MTRSCYSCNQEISLGDTPIFTLKERQDTCKSIVELFQKLIKGFSVSSLSRQMIREILIKFESDIKSGKSKNIKFIYNCTIPGLLEFVNDSPDSTILVSQISEFLIKLETYSSNWQDLIFLHLEYFPFLKCPNCQEWNCFRCGSKKHLNLSCLEYLKLQIDPQLESSLSKTLDWKIKNSKSCPKCQILITRDDGCNKMECGYCGHQFCWECLGIFESSKCGYYRCIKSSKSKEITDLDHIQRSGMERRLRVKFLNYNEEDESVRDKTVRKKSLSSVLNKILTSLKQKDTFGFFLMPVDVNAVPDYLKFIEHPMDFSTMTEKVSEYSSINEFKHDFDLVVSNAKKYNAPSTIYYKEAVKLANYGFPLIEREAKSVATLQELEELQNDAIKRRLELSSRKRLAQGKKNHKEALEELIIGLYSGDGTFLRRNIENDELYNTCRFQKHLDFYSVDYQNSLLAPSENRLAEGFGWIPPNPTDLQCSSKIEASFLYHTYGNKRGYTYALSLEQLAKDVPFLSGKINQFLSEITEDGHQIVKNVQEMMKVDKKEREQLNIESNVIETKKGRLDVIGRLREIEYQVQKILDNTFLENIKREAADIAPLLKPLTNFANPEFQASLSTAANQSLLDDNLKDIEDLIKLADSEDTANEKLNILEKVRRRLVHLVSLAPPSEFGGAPNQSMLSASRGFSGNRVIPGFAKRPPEPSQTQPSMNMPSLNLTQLQQMQQMRSAMRASGGNPFIRHMNPSHTMINLPQQVARPPQSGTIPPKYFMQPKRE